MLSGTIAIGLCSEGHWWYWWSSAGRIADADDLDGAVRAVGRVFGDRTAQG